MKFIVIGKSAVLTSRSITRIDSDNDTSITVDNVPDGATITFIGEEQNTSAEVLSEKASVDFSEFNDGIYATSVTWKTTEDGSEHTHTAYGNPILISADDDGRYIIPAPLASATEIENVWRAVADILELLVPFYDDTKNGPSVV